MTLTVIAQDELSGKQCFFFSLPNLIAPPPAEMGVETGAAARVGLNAGVNGKLLTC